MSPESTYVEAVVEDRINGGRGRALRLMGNGCSCYSHPIVKVTSWVVVVRLIVLVVAIIVLMMVVIVSVISSVISPISSSLSIPTKVPS